MEIMLRGGPLEGKAWPAPVNADDTRISTRIGGEKVVYADTGERHPVTGDRIFAYRPPKPKPSEGLTNDEAEDDDDDE